MRISDVIKFVQAGDHFNISPEIEIAKGRFEYIDTVARFKKQARRSIKSKYYGKKT